MTPALAVFTLIFSTLVLFLMPLLPALIELRRRSDIEPIQVVREYDVDVHSFANNFRKYLDTHYHSAFAHCDERTKPFYGTDNEGKQFQIITDDNIKLFDAEIQQQSSFRIFLGCHSLQLPGAMSYLSELYARESVYGGEEDIYRAILAKKDIQLDRNSMLLRWLHAGRNLVIQQDCILHGRASADQIISIDKGCQFERLYAPRIEFGLQDVTFPYAQPLFQQSTQPPHSSSSGSSRRWLYDHDVVIPGDAFLDADLVVRGKLKISSGSSIAGSIKSHDTLQIDSGVKISGSVISNGDLYLANDCQISGPVVAEGDIHVGQGCQIGFSDHATSVIAQRIFIQTGSVVYGTVWAHDHGEVTTVAGKTNSRTVRSPDE